MIEKIGVWEPGSRCSLFRQLSGRSASPPVSVFIVVREQQYGRANPANDPEENLARLACAGGSIGLLATDRLASGHAARPRHEGADRQHDRADPRLDDAAAGR